MASIMQEKNFGEKESPEKLLRGMKERELKFKNKWETN